ncbi:MAG: right-handed parallel beta-helix repeat-containing protein, partial [Candidatus Heimdallarchaeota archaeon]
NSLLYGGGLGILLLNVGNASLINNIIINNHIGIYLNTCESIIVKDNQIYDNDVNGINIYSSNSNYFYNNTIYNNVLSGITMYEGRKNSFSTNNITLNNNGITFSTCLNNTIMHCNITNNELNGISLFRANITFIYENWIYQNTYSSVYMEKTNYSTILRNNLSANANAVHLIDSENNKINYNNLSSNTEVGLIISGTKNNIESNNIKNTPSYGLKLETQSSDNEIVFNNFLSNNPSGTSQAYDSGTNNLVHCNYWCDWTTPNENPVDEFVDIPYDLDGSAYNEDPYPLAEPVGYTNPIICPTAEESGTEGLFISIIFCSPVVLIPIAYNRKKKRK